MQILPILVRILLKIIRDNTSNDKGIAKTISVSTEIFQIVLKHNPLKRITFQSPIHILLEMQRNVSYNAKSEKNADIFNSI